MTNQAVASSNDGEANPAHSNHDDDASEATQTDTRRLKKPADLLIEKTVKFRFLKLDEGHSVDPALFHLHWIKMVQEAFGDSIQVFTNNGSIMPKINPHQWNAEQHGKMYKVITPESNKGNRFQPSARKKFGESKETATFIIHRIRTSLTMTAIKNIRKISELLVDNKVFLTEHRWAEDVWDLHRHGFVLGLDPQIYDPLQAKEKLMNDIRQRVPKNMKIPKFHVAFCSPKTVQDHIFLKTKAYAIETERHNMMEMVKVLKIAYQETHEFVPFQMRSSHPESYARSIKRQTQLMADTRSISLNYIGCDAMFYLMEHILAIPKVKAVVPAPTIEQDGRYRVSVAKDEFITIRTHLQRHLTGWIEAYVTDEEAQRSLQKYPDPPEVSMIDYDVYSTGDGTYMTDSANTAMSYDSVTSDLTHTGDSQASQSSYSGLPKASTSWAARIRGSINQQYPPNSLRDTAPHGVPPGIVVNDEMISDLASSRAEVDELKQQLAQIAKDKDLAKQEYEQQRKEMQLEAAKQKFEYIKQVDAQRKDMEQKLAEQKAELQSQAKNEREALERSINDKIEAAIQANNAKHQPAAPTTQTIDMQRYFDNNDRQMKLLTDLIARLSSASPAIDPPVPRSASTKRPAEVVDLTGDNPDIENLKLASRSDKLRADIAERKRRDIRNTPQKAPLSKSSPSMPKFFYAHHNPITTASPASEMSSSVAPTPERRPHPSTWLSYHRTPDTKSTRYGYEETGDDSSDRQHEDDTMVDHPLLPPYETEDGMLEDNSITPTHLADIFAQHASADTQPPSENGNDPHEEMSVSSASPTIQDQPDSLPTRTEGENPKDVNHEHRENSETNNTTRDTILTSTNQRENKYWGDELQEKEQGMMRIYSINVNGLSIDRRGGKFSDICSAIKEVQCDIFCGQEHNLDTTQAIVRKILYDTAKQHWERLRLNLGTSPIEYKTQFKPGGTFMLTVGHTTGRTIEQTQDKWGRWVTTQFQGRGDSKLAVVNVYQVVDKHGESGVLSTTRQQQTLLMQAEDSVTDPRKAFKRDLRQDLQGFRTQGFELLILGDFNETFGEDIDGIESIANDLGLLHLMKKRHSTISLPATYARGQRCIDYALGTARVHSSLHAAGYEPFNQRVHTDHRGYFLDFNTAILFGMETPTLANRDSRMLQSWNVPQMTAYLRYKYDLLEKQNAFIRGERLTHLGNRHAFAERLDGDVLQASLIAEKKTHRYREPAWSVELAEARKTVSILSKTLSALRTGLNLNHILLHDMSAMNTRFDLPRTRQSCSIALRKAKVTVRTIVKQSYNTRDTERKRKIQILERSNNAIDRSTVKHLKRMKKSEEIRQLFGKLRSIQRTQERRGVTRLEIPIHPEADPKSCTEWQQIDIPDKILDHLIKRNQYHFGQAHGTPFTIPPLSDQLGFTANTAASHDILTGQFDSQQLDSNVQLLISHLRQVQEMEHEPARPTITDEEYVAKLQIWSENTTTSPSGLHLGHYKALIGRHTHSLEAPNHAVPPEFATIRDELNFKQQAMRRLHLQLLNYALERGYAYSRWKTVANTILFKDTDNYRIHRTRVIHLYEADYNMALGIKWRAAMHQAEDLKCLNDGQYGSRPNRRANDPVILEELQFEISRATRMPVALTSYDAMACYDRIIPSVAMLASRKYGIPETVANMNAETLQGATYRLKTEMGLAEKGYSHDHNGLPIYGTGQGSGNSPAIWCFVSSTLFDCYEEQAHAAYYCDPTRNLEVQLGMTGFVDDCGGQVTDHQAGGAPDRERLRQKVEHNAQSWTNLLSASGGALELTKCSCHMVQWQFTAQGAPVLVPSNSNDPIQVTVTDPHTRISHHVQMLSPFTAHKTLGHYKEPAGTQSTQAQALQKKSDTITEFLWTNRLSRMEAWTYYYACYLPAVTYPLPASSMTEKQLATVQRKALSIIVARCGYNRNTKKEILFGPASLGGANFRDLYVEQGIGQVTLFLRHWRGFTQISKMLRIAVSWFQLTVGSSTPILENTRMVLPHLESKWIGSLRTFLAKIQGSLRLDATYVQPKQRVQDEYIMDRVMESGKFTEAEIRRINYCRIYLRAVTVSDIASIAGDRLDMHKIRGSPSVESSASRLEWPRQDKPAPREWSLWKSANTLWSTVSGQLLTPLGQWTSPIHDQRQSHYAYQSPGHIFIRTGEQYRAFTRTSDQFFGGHGKLVDFADIADDAQPVSVSYDDSNLWSITDETKIQYLRPSPPAITFDQYIHTLDPWEITLLRHQELYADPRAIGFALEDGFYAASDGSVIAEEKGSYGWTISTVLGERASTGTGPVGGSQLQPYRAEAVAMLSLLCFLHRLAEFIGKHDHWYGVIVTDSQSLLDTLGNWLPQVIPTPPKIPKSYFISPYTEVLLPEWDVLIEIYHLLRRMPHITLEYVKSHQDRHQPYHQLSLKAQLNVDADAAAKQYQRTHANIHPLAMLLPHTGALLDLPDGTITSNFPDRMRHQAWGGPLKKYMQEKYNWSASTMDAINWKAQTSALQRQFHRKTHMTKLIHDILPTNSKVHRADKTKQRCPECPCKKEDRDHVLQCPAASRQQIKHDMMQRFQHGCEKHKTDPDLQNLLLNVVRAWMDQPADETYTPQEQNFPITLADLIRTQSAIGWRQLFNGRFSIQWAQRQDEYYARLDTNQRNRRQTGQHWQTNIIGELWEAWFLIWEKRNQDIHGFDVHSKAEATRRKVNQSLREIYDLRHQLEPSVRELLEEDVDVHHRRPTWVNQNWLAVHGPLVATSVRKFKNGVLRGVRSIRDYMVRTDN